MADYLAFNATTHPIVRLEDDYNNLLAHGLEKSYDFLVRINGSYYEAIQGGGSSGAGTIAYGGANNAGGTTGTDSADVIQAALDNLTAGRDYKETVAINGDITIDQSVDVSSYTRLDLTGARLTLADSSDEDVIKNKDADNTYIDIIGGIIDGNQANQTPASVISGIYFDTVTFGNIYGVTVTDPLRFGIRIDDSSFYNTVTSCYIDDSDENAGLYIGPGCQMNHITNVHVQDCWGGVSLNGAVVHNVLTNVIVYNSDGVGFSLYDGASRNTFSSCDAIACGQAIPPTESGGGFYLEKNADANAFSACVSQGNAEDGFAVNGFGGASINNTFSSCVAHSNTLHGFDLTNGSAYNTLAGCQSVSNTRNGVFIYDSDDNTITGCNIRNNSQAGAGTYSGVMIDNGSLTNTISGCRIIDDGAPTQDYGIEETNTSDYTRIVGNNTMGGLTGGVTIVGPNSAGDIQPMSHQLLDLSGAGIDEPIFTMFGNGEVIGYKIVYVELSSADAGVVVRMGSYANNTYFDSVTSEVNKAQGYVKTYVTADLTNTIIAGDVTVICGTAGGKVGTGAVRVIPNIVLYSGT